MGELLYNLKLDETFLILTPSSECSSPPSPKTLSKILNSHEHVMESEPFKGYKLVKVTASRLPLRDSLGTSQGIYF